MANTLGHVSLTAADAYCVRSCIDPHPGLGSCWSVGPCYWGVSVIWMGLGAMEWRDQAPASGVHMHRLGDGLIVVEGPEWL